MTFKARKKSMYIYTDISLFNYLTNHRSLEYPSSDSSSDSENQESDCTEDKWFLTDGGHLWVYERAPSDNKSPRGFYFTGYAITCSVKGKGASTVFSITVKVAPNCMFYYKFIIIFCNDFIDIYNFFLFNLFNF